MSTDQLSLFSSASAPPAAMPARNFDQRDICANRHGGNPQSKAANCRVGYTKAEQRRHVLTFIQVRGALGATTDEVAAGMGKPPNAVSGRLTELKAAGLIVKCGTRRTRSGCSAGVFVDASFAGKEAGESC